VSKPALGLTQPLSNKYGGPPPLPGLKRPRCKSNHTPPSNAQNRRVYSYTSIPHTRSLRGTQLSTWQKYLTDGNRGFTKDPLVKFLKRTLKYATIIYSCRPGPNLINSPSTIVLTITHRELTQHRLGEGQTKHNVFRSRALDAKVAKPWPVVGNQV